MVGEALGARKKRGQVPFTVHAKRDLWLILRLPTHAQNKLVF